MHPEQKRIYKSYDCRTKMGAGEQTLLDGQEFEGGLAGFIASGLDRGASKKRGQGDLSLCPKLT